LDDKILIEEEGAKFLL